MKKMTVRQRILRILYPALMWVTKMFRKDKSINMGKAFSKTEPSVSFYSLSAVRNDGAEILFADFKGKIVLLVNTASGCGYTEQYSELQKLYELYNERVIVLAFPSNDFKEQEKENDAEIARFCKLNFGITFPLLKKSAVIKSPDQHPVYQWLTDAGKNGWCNQSPEWNFSKYLVNESGMLTHYFAPSVSPLSNEVKEAISG